jgi:hypothetical protein
MVQLAIGPSVKESNLVECGSWEDPIAYQDQ